MKLRKQQKITQMGSIKGQKSNNPNGRPKGVPNKVTKNLRQAVMDLLDTNWAKIQKDLKLVDPKDRLAFLEKMMAYVLPKLQSTTIDATVETIKRLDDLDAEQLNKLIEIVIQES